MLFRTKLRGSSKTGQVIRNSYYQVPRKAVQKGMQRNIVIIAPDAKHGIGKVDKMGAL